LKTEMATAAGRRSSESNPLPSSRTSTSHAPLPTIRRGWTTAGRLACVLERFLDDTQRDDLDGLRQLVDTFVELDGHGDRERRGDLVAGLTDRTTQAEIGEEGRAQLLR